MEARIGATVDAVIARDVNRTANAAVGSYKKNITDAYHRRLFCLFCFFCGASAAVHLISISFA